VVKYRILFLQSKIEQQRKDLQFAALYLSLLFIGETLFINAENPEATKNNGVETTNSMSCQTTRDICRLRRAVS